MTTRTLDKRRMLWIIIALNQSWLAKEVWNAVSSFVASRRETRKYFNENTSTSCKSTGPLTLTPLSSNSNSHSHSNAMAYLIESGNQSNRRDRITAMPLGYIYIHIYICFISDDRACCFFLSWRFASRFEDCTSRRWIMAWSIRRVLYFSMSDLHLKTHIFLHDQRPCEWKEASTTRKEWRRYGIHTLNNQKWIE